MASPVLIVAADAIDNGTINKIPETLSAIECPATIFGPKGLKRKETREKQATSIVVEMARGKPKRRKLKISCFFTS